jgi:hypothetical protein
MHYQQLFSTIASIRKDYSKLVYRRRAMSVKIREKHTRHTLQCSADYCKVMQSENLTVEQEA